MTEPVRYLADDEFEVAKAENLTNHILCRQMYGECYGYHCSRCGGSVGMLGHGDACRIKRLGERPS